MEIGQPEAGWGLRIMPSSISLLASLPTADFFRYLSQNLVGLSMTTAQASALVQLASGGAFLDLFLGWIEISGQLAFRFHSRSGSKSFCFQLSAGCSFSLLRFNILGIR